MRAVSGVILFTFFGYCEMVAWGFLALLLNKTFIPPDVLLSPELMFELYLNAPLMYILSRLGINLVVSVVFGLFLAFLYGLIRRFFMLPETIIEKTDTRSFFKWQTIGLLCFGLCYIAWRVYKIFHPYPEAWF